MEIKKKILLTDHIFLLLNRMLDLVRVPTMRSNHVKLMDHDVLLELLQCSLDLTL